MNGLTGLDLDRVPVDADEASRKRQAWDRFYRQPVAHENLPLSVWELEQFQRHVLTGHGRSAIDVGCGWGS